MVPRSELSLRILSGVAMVTVALAAAWAGGVPFVALWCAAAVAIACEWMAMTRAEPRILLSCVASAGLLILCWISATNPAPGALLLAVGVTGAALAFLSRGRETRGWSTAGFLYAALVAVVPVMVRQRPDLGAAAILWIFAVVWTTDIAAFFAGRSLGGPRLWPAVSPRKTWSGFAGGLLGATLAGTVLHRLATVWPVDVPLGLGATMALSALASVACQLGDLGESALKRRFAVKDSGRLIPGHGGVMDRLDGFVAVMLLLGLALAGARPFET